MVQMLDLYSCLMQLQNAKLYISYAAVDLGIFYCLHLVLSCLPLTVSLRKMGSIKEFAPGRHWYIRFLFRGMKQNLSGACYLTLKFPSRPRTRDDFWNFFDTYGYRYGDGNTCPLLPSEIIDKTICTPSPCVKYA